VTRIELAPQVLDDFDRFLDHLVRFEVESPAARIKEIIQAIQVLSTSPFVGRAVRGGKRELVIGQGVRGYLALYRNVPELDTVFILAVQSQREAGYKDPPA
jgi:toxin ParE1/3/4